MTDKSDRIHIPDSSSLVPPNIVAETASGQNLARSLYEMRSYLNRVHGGGVDESVSST